MVKQYSPKGFVIENVPGMATMYKGQVKDEVLKRFTEMGYNVDCRILKACDYGVPQMRKRLVFMIPCGINLLRKVLIKKF